MAAPLLWIVAFLLAGAAGYAASKREWFWTGAFAAQAVMAVGLYLVVMAARL